MRRRIPLSVALARFSPCVRSVVIHPIVTRVRSRVRRRRARTSAPPRRGSPRSRWTGTTSGRSSAPAVRTPTCLSGPHTLSPRLGRSARSQEDAQTELYDPAPLAPPRKRHQGPRAPHRLQDEHRPGLIPNHRQGPPAQLLAPPPPAAASAGTRPPKLFVARRRPTRGRLCPPPFLQVALFAPSAAALSEAKAILDKILASSTRQGSAYQGRVVSLKDFGAIVELPNGDQARGRGVGEPACGAGRARGRAGASAGRCGLRRRSQGGSGSLGSHTGRAAVFFAGAGAHLGGGARADVPDRGRPGRGGHGADTLRVAAGRPPGRKPRPRATRQTGLFP